MQKARRHPAGGLRPLVGTRFQVLFHSPPGVLFTFPSRYWFAIGRQGVLSLAGWSPRVRSGFPVPGATQVADRGGAGGFAYGAVTRCRGPFQAASATACLCDLPPFARGDGRPAPTTPLRTRPARQSRAHRFGLVPFRSPLLGESSFLSLPPVTEMCHFTGLPSPALCVQAGIGTHYGAWVAPFGDPRVTGRSAPHRGLSQPSTSFLGSWRQGIHRVPFVS